MIIILLISLKKEIHVKEGLYILKKTSFKMKKILISN